MSLTQRDLEKISETVGAAIQQERSAFWVEPEEHYRQHEQLGALLSVWSDTKSTVMKFIIGTFLLGILAAMVVVAKMKTGA